MTALETYIRELAKEGVRIHIWPTSSGHFQANVSERAGDGWTCHTDDDPIDALVTALRLRATGSYRRIVVVDAEPEQIDIEEVIAAAPPPPTIDTDSDFEDLL